MLTVSSNGSEIAVEGVALGETDLTEDTDFTLDGLEITLLKEYLDGLTEGEQIFTITTNYFDVDVTIEIVDTTEG